VVGYPVVLGKEFGSVDLRELATRREPVRVAAGREALHVDDLALAKGEDHNPIWATSARAPQGAYAMTSSPI
jgi:hypothetical protein